MADFELMGFLSTTVDFQPIGNLTTATVFRFTSINYQNIDRRLRTYGFAKMAYLGGGGKMWTRWYKFYPGIEPVVLEIPLPKELELAGFVTRQLYIGQKRLKYGDDPIGWDLKVDQLT